MSEYSIPEDLAKKLNEAEAIAAKQKFNEEKKKESENKELYPHIKVGEEELLSFWDSMLKKKPFEETYKIRELSIVFRTRSTQEIHELFERIDSLTYSLDSTLTKVHVDFTLASALKSLGSDNLEGMKFEDKLKFVRSLPAPLTKLVIDQLDHFDCKVGKMTEMLKTGNF